MPNTIERNASNRLWDRILTGVGLVGITLSGTAIGLIVPDVMKANGTFWEQTAIDRGVLEKYAPQEKNGEPLTVEQGIELILQEHDNNPKDGKISIAESFDVFNRVKRHEGRAYAALDESSKNLFQALMEINKKQTK